MFSRFICINYMKTGKCTDPSCTLQHVTDIDSMDKGSAKSILSKSIKKTEEKKEESKGARTVTSSISIISGSDSAFNEGTRPRRGVLAEERKKKEEEKKMKETKCKFLFEKGTCRMGDKCFFSHEGYSGVPSTGRMTAAEFESRGGMRGGRGGMRGGRGGRPMTSTGPRDHSADSSGIPTVPFRGGRGGFRGDRPRRDFNGGNSTKEPARMITLKRNDSDSEPKDITDLDSQVRRIYADLIRLEPLRRAMGAGKSLDMMFIIDCTGSMGSWINTCKQEIKAIIDCVRNQHFNIKIRISIVAYRDHCDGEDISEVFRFSDDIAACQKFLKDLRATGGGDMPEDVAGGFENALKQDWQAKSKYAIFIADAPCHGTQYHDTGSDDYPKGDPKGRVVEK